MNALNLQNQLAANVAANPEDVLAVKTALQNLGLYEAPQWGLSDVPDRALFDAIKTFQKGAKSRTDGMMKPGGETETAIQTAAELVRRHGRHGDTVLAHITPAEAELLHRITDGGSINPDTGLPEFFIGNVLGGLASSFVSSFAGPGIGSVVGSTLGNVAGQAIGDYASQKIGQKIGGPLGEILGNTVGGFLGSGSPADITSGLVQSLSNATGNYVSRKVGDKVGNKLDGSFGNAIGNALGGSVGNAVGSAAGNAMSGTLSSGIAALSTPSPSQSSTRQPSSGESPSGVGGELGNDPLSRISTPYGTPGINPQADDAVRKSLPKSLSETQSSAAWLMEQPKDQSSASDPVLQGPLGPLKNLMTGKPFRAKDFDAPKPQTQTPPRSAERSMALPAETLAAETLAANGRTANALLKTSDHSAIKPHVTQTWNNGGAQGRAEVLNLAQQIKDRNPAIGAKFERDMGVNNGATVLTNDRSEHKYEPQGNTKDRFDTLYERLHGREGGYVNHPNDYGGETNLGITKETLGAYQAQHGGLGDGGKNVDIKSLTREQAKTVYKKAFYDHYRIGEIKDNVLAEDVFDLHANSKPTTASKILQKSINDAVPEAKLEVDGRIGTKTIGALNDATPKQRHRIHESINQNRAEFYKKRIKEDTSQEDFKKGWRNRLDILR